jgi:pyruvate dehydrogenase E2 component (dihydrolipoamide acetyltransferase)
MAIEVPPVGMSRVAATPVAARMAEVAGIDLAVVPVVGRRVTKADVEAILRGQTAGDRGARQSASAIAGSGADRIEGSPYIFLQVDCRVDALLELRQQINDSSAQVAVTVVDIVVAACGLALQHVPAANASWVGGRVRLFDSVDIAVTVTLPGGLVSPVVRACQRKTLARISRELQDLSERALADSLRPKETADGTFTISSTGRAGVADSPPTISPPQCCVLSIGAVEPRALVDDGRLVPGHVMSCVLAADRRAIDGAGGAELLEEIRRLVEDPMTIMLGL